MVKGIEIWKKSVIHIECATDSVSYQEKVATEELLRSQFESGVITEEEYMISLSQVHSKGSKDIRYQGTAIFLEHNSRRYLLTARHVIEDTIGTKHRIEEMKKWGRSSLEDRAFNIIFRVPRLDEVQKALDFNILAGLNSGIISMRPFSFSKPELDLAIISLDNHYSEFADQLIEDGYLPILLEDINSDEVIHEGEEIYSIGFPGITSVLGERNISIAENNWSSASISLPVYSFGKVAMQHEKLDYFWGDITIYPGNSGGPVISNGKLIGIVSAQPLIPSEQIINTNSGNVEPLLAVTRVPFAKIIKAKYINELLEEQINKDKQKF